MSAHVVGRRGPIEEALLLAAVIAVESGTTAEMRAAINALTNDERAQVRRAIAMSDNPDLYQKAGAKLRRWWNLPDPAPLFDAEAGKTSHGNVLRSNARQVPGEANG